VALADFFQVVIFFCQNIGYKKTELSQLLPLPNKVSVRLVALPCSGKIEVQFLLKTFETGIDAIFILGCLDGTCHYIQGNHKARKRVQYVKDILNEIGIDGDRLEMFQISSDGKEGLQKMVTEINNRMGRLIPSPLKNKEAA
jgi:F420-non-reducing hydrogenase iron-sulfur subunit